MWLRKGPIPTRLSNRPKQHMRNQLISSTRTPNLLSNPCMPKKLQVGKAKLPTFSVAFRSETILTFHLNRHLSPVHEVWKSAEASKSPQQTASVYTSVIYQGSMNNGSNRPTMSKRKTTRYREIKRNDICERVTAPDKPSPSDKRLKSHNREPASAHNNTH